MSALLAAEVDPSRVSAGPLGLLVVLLMLVATALLVRNMNARLRKLPKEFPPHDEQDDDRAPRP